MTSEAQHAEGNCGSANSTRLRASTGNGHHHIKRHLGGVALCDLATTGQFARCHPRPGVMLASWSQVVGKGSARSRSRTTLDRTRRDL